MDIEFLDPADEHKRQLERLVDGARSGTVVEAIRNSIRAGERTLDQELRNRPVDQKSMLAMHARSEEITALIRDANPTVIIRLLDSPRMTPAHTMQMLRNRRQNVRLKARKLCARQS